MKYLIYCIFHTPRHPETVALSGVEEQPVALVSNNGLTAAISGITQPNLLPDASWILTYKRVVDFFHHGRSVIPMRYGCMLNGKQQVIRLLKEDENQYRLLLWEVKGCVEMGLRVLIAEGGLGIAELENSDPQSAIRNPHSHISGRGYLADRKTHYEQEDKLGKEIDTIIDRYRKAFSGLYVKSKTEYQQFRISDLSLIQNHLLSLYFLVPRDSVDHFRQVFRRISQDEAAKFLLSGPWPPYNFVIPESKVQSSKVHGSEVHRNP